MNLSRRTLHLILASSASLSFIVCAYLFSGPYSFRPMSVDAATAESLLKSYAAKDTDSDGLPDWQESLYGTDPANPESVAIGVLDGDAVEQGLVKPKFTGNAAPEDTSTERIPGSPADDTVTARFARSFFTEYFSTYAGQASLTEEQMLAFTRGAVEELVRENASKQAFSSANITVSGEGGAALSSYLVKAETSLNKSTLSTTKSELAYMDDAIARNDRAALEKVRAIGASYTSIAKQFAALSVPREAKDAHLALANALSLMGSVTTDMGTSDTDPVRSLVGLTQYQDATDELTRSIAAYRALFVQAGAVPSQGQPGYELYATVLLANNTLGL